MDERRAMTDEPNIPPEVAQEMDAELQASSGMVSTPPLCKKCGWNLTGTDLSRPCGGCGTVNDPGPSASTWTGPSLAPVVTPLVDLRARLAMLKDADVEVYEDGPLRLKFDVEGRRLARVQRETPTEEPKW